MCKLMWEKNHIYRNYYVEEKKYDQTKCANCISRRAKKKFQKIINVGPLIRP